MDPSLKIASLNVRGMNSAIKRLAVYDWTRRQNIDILCLQETFIAEPDSTWSHEFPNYKIYHSFGSNHSRGVSVLVKENHDLTSTIQEVDLDGRYLILCIDFQNTRFFTYNSICPGLI